MKLRAGLRGLDEVCRALDSRLCGENYVVRGVESSEKNPKNMGWGGEQSGEKCVGQSGANAQKCGNPSLRPSHAIIFLNGEIGAGKSAFVRAFAAFCGVSDCVTSPTFNLMHIYGEKNGGNDENGAKNGRIFHYDFYQRPLQNALDLGVLDLLGESGLHFVEWGDENLKKMVAHAYGRVLEINITKCAAPTKKSAKKTTEKSAQKLAPNARNYEFVG